MILFFQEIFDFGNGVFDGESEPLVEFAGRSRESETFEQAHRKISRIEIFSTYRSVSNLWKLINYFPMTTFCLANATYFACIP